MKYTVYSNVTREMKKPNGTSYTLKMKKHKTCVTYSRPPHRLRGTLGAAAAEAEGEGASEASQSKGGDESPIPPNPPTAPKRLQGPRPGGRPH